MFPHKKPIILIICLSIILTSIPQDALALRPIAYKLQMTADAAKGKFAIKFKGNLYFIDIVERSNDAWFYLYDDKHRDIGFVYFRKEGTGILRKTADFGGIYIAQDFRGMDLSTVLFYIYFEYLKEHRYEALEDDATTTDERALGIYHEAKRRYFDGSAKAPYEVVDRAALKSASAGKPVVTFDFEAAGYRFKKIPDKPLPKHQYKMLIQPPGKEPATVSVAEINIGGVNIALFDSTWNPLLSKYSQMMSGVLQTQLLGIPDSEVKVIVDLGAGAGNLCFASLARFPNAVYFAIEKQEITFANLLLNVKRAEESGAISKGKIIPVKGDSLEALRAYPLFKTGRKADLIIDTRQAVSAVDSIEMRYLCNMISVFKEFLLPGGRLLICAHDPDDVSQAAQSQDIGFKFDVVSRPNIPDSEPLSKTRIGIVLGYTPTLRSVPTRPAPSAGIQLFSNSAFATTSLSSPFYWTKLFFVAVASYLYFVILPYLKNNAPLTSKEALSLVYEKIGTDIRSLWEFFVGSAVIYPRNNMAGYPDGLGGPHISIYPIPRDKEPMWGDPVKWYATIPVYKPSKNCGSAQSGTIKSASAGQGQPTESSSSGSEELIGLMQASIARMLGSAKDATQFKECLEKLQAHGWRYSIVALSDSAKTLLPSIVEGEIIDLSGVHMVNQSDNSGQTFSDTNKAKTGVMKLIETLKGNDIYRAPILNSSLDRFVDNSLVNVLQHARKDVCVFLYRPIGVQETDIEGFRVVAVDHGEGFKNTEYGSGEDVPIQDAIQFGVHFGTGGCAGEGLKIALSSASLFRIETNDEKAVYKHLPGALMFFNDPCLLYFRDPSLRISGVILDAVFYNKNHKGDYWSDLVEKERARISGLVATKSASAGTPTEGPLQISNILKVNFTPAQLDALKKLKRETGFDMDEFISTGKADYKGEGFHFVFWLRRGTVLGETNYLRLWYGSDHPEGFQILVFDRIRNKFVGSIENLIYTSNRGDRVKIIEDDYWHGVFALEGYTPDKTDYDQYSRLLAISKQTLVAADESRLHRVPEYQQAVSLWVAPEYRNVRGESQRTAPPLLGYSGLRQTLAALDEVVAVHAYGAEAKTFTATWRSAPFHRAQGAHTNDVPEEDDLPHFWKGFKKDDLTRINRIRILQEAGFKLARETTDRFDHSVKEVLSRIADSGGRIKSIPEARVAVIGVGSVARQEMTAGSDADIAVVFGGNISDLQQNTIKDTLREGLKELGYAAEIPICGTVAECRSFCKRSPLNAEEAKQMRFIDGDKNLLLGLQNTGLFPFTLNIQDPTAVGSIYYAIWDYEREHRILDQGKFKDLKLRNIKKSRGMMRDILTICVIARTIGGVNETSCLAVLETMRKRGLLSDEEFLKLRDALNFYLLVRDRFHSIKDTIQPAEPEGLALAELLETHRKDTVAPSVMPALARDLGFTDEQALSNALDRHSNNVLGIYNDIQKRLLDELRQNKRYGPDWVGAFSKASDVAAAEREHEEIFSAYENSGEQGKPILFALAWHSRHPKVLEKLYTYYNRTNYLYVAYGLSDNRSTPKNIVEELYAKIGDEYLQVRHRAEENLKDKAAIKSASVGSERKIVNAYQPAKATEALPLEDRIAAAISAAA